MKKFVVPLGVQKVHFFLKIKKNIKKKKENGTY